jgi:hypothetical protein
VPQRTPEAGAELRIGVDNSLNEDTPRLTNEDNDDDSTVIAAVGTFCGNFGGPLSDRGRGKQEPCHLKSPLGLPGVETGIVDGYSPRRQFIQQLRYCGR